MDCKKRTRVGGPSETMEVKERRSVSPDSATNRASPHEPSSFSVSSSLVVESMNYIVNHDDTSGRVSTPPIDEIKNPDELPPSVEVDVVGDLPPTLTCSSSIDSGVISDLSCSINNTDLQQSGHTVKEEYVVQDLSNHGTRRPKGASPEASFSRTSSDLYATPDRNFSNKPMFTSTPIAPVSRLWSPWLHPQPQMNAMHFQPPNIYPYISSIALQPTYTLLRPPLILSQQHINGAITRRAAHAGFVGFDHHKYSNTLAQANLGLLASPQHSNTSFSLPLHLDLPLNLTNRRPFQNPAAEATSPHGSAYSNLASSARNIICGDQNQPRSEPSYKNRVSTHLPFTVLDNCNLPGPSYAVPVLPKQQEYPLNMCTVVNRQGPSTTGGENNEGPSECKKRRISRTKKKDDKPLQLTEIPGVHNKVVKMESEPTYQTTPQPITEHIIRGVILGSPPPGARPISLLMKTKEKIECTERRTARSTKKYKDNFCDGENETAKQRNKPELFGDTDITELNVVFYECPERGTFCDGNLKFQVPKIPDSLEGQSELKQALLRLFSNSNLPSVPSALKHSVHALSQYPFMQHIFSLHFQGVNLDALKFGAYGLAFENIRLVELGEQMFNDILDRMSYLGEDDLLHCLVKNEKTGALCGHVAYEIGKIRRHSKNHYPDKKWVCVFCRVQMCDMTDLERHTATHTELKPFECPQCSKKFCQKVTLTQHMHKGHGQELVKWDAKSSYICRQDGCSFSQGEEMSCIRHLKQHHSQSDYIKRKNQNKWPFSCLSEDVIKSLDEET